MVWWCLAAQLHRYMLSLTYPEGYSVYMHPEGSQKHCVGQFQYHTIYNTKWIHQCARYPMSHPSYSVARVPLRVICLAICSAASTLRPATALGCSPPARPVCVRGVYIIHEPYGYVRCDTCYVMCDTEWFSPYTSAGVVWWAVCGGLACLSRLTRTASSEKGLKVNRSATPAARPCPSGMYRSYSWYRPSTPPKLQDVM